MDRSNIEWTESTWNPTVGCTEVSPGCDHCYAKRMTQRFPQTYPNGFDKWYSLGNCYEYSLQITAPSAGSSAIGIIAVGRATGSAAMSRASSTSRSLAWRPRS